MQVKVKILKTSGFSKADLAKIDAAVCLLDTVLNSQMFRSEFLKEKLTENKGKTNAEIIDHLLSGDCQFTDADGSIDLKLVMYYKRWSSVVGYFDGTPLTIFINRKFFSSHIDIASNLLHEYFHLMGYSHYKAFQTSVPYTANRVFERCVKAIGFKIPSSLASCRLAA